MCEVWDDLARKVSEQGLLRKGKYLYLLGYMLAGKWVDKVTGEEHKYFRFRTTRLLSENAARAISAMVEEVAVQDEERQELEKAIASGAAVAEPAEASSKEGDRKTTSLNPTWDQVEKQISGT
jgi:hypothetical protein